MGDTTEHALLSPSSAVKWMTCPGAIVMEQGYPDKSSDYADEGTAAHEMAAQVLTGVDTFAGIVGGVHANGHRYTQEMADYVKVYTDYVDSLLLLPDSSRSIEVRMSIAHLTGENNAYGTSDAVVCTPDELIVIDLKYGQGLKVEAAENAQLMIYALAALEEYSLLYSFKRVRLVISQPRLRSLSEWDCSVEELLAFGEEVRSAAAHTLSVLASAAEDPVAGHLNPSEKACKWCKAKNQCQARDKLVADTVFGEFDDLTEAFSREKPVAVGGTAELLALQFSKIKLIEDWCKGVASRVQSQLLDGKPVPGYKLVEGKRGNRAWSDVLEAEKVLRSMRLKIEDMYNLALISPTEAEKLTAGRNCVIGPRQWERVKSLIVRNDGKPTVAADTDKRPALVVDLASDFENVAEDLC